MRVLFDIYHQQITEENLIRNITENIDLIGHFHIADNPGRCEPGTGEISLMTNPCFENTIVKEHKEQGSLREGAPAKRVKESA